MPVIPCPKCGHVLGQTGQCIECLLGGKPFSGAHPGPQGFVPPLPARTCGYGDEEEATAHAPMCATQRDRPQGPKKLVALAGRGWPSGWAAYAGVADGPDVAWPLVFEGEPDHPAVAVAASPEVQAMIRDAWNRMVEESSQPSEKSRQG